MPDWKKIVSEKLGTLPLRNGRRDEVIEELAQQLESAYEEALAQGINEQEAMRRSLAQFKDWDKLRMELFQSVEGTRLPVWEQSGFFAPRRWPVWISLALTLAFVATPTFRQALEIIPIPGSYPEPLSSQIFSEKALHRIEQSGDKEKYARALAFVALHGSPEDGLQAARAAEKAIALDPQLTWISAKVIQSSNFAPGVDAHPWIERLQVWDPQNGFPYLLQSTSSVHYWEPPWSKYSGTKLGLRLALAAEPRWRIPVEKAFTAPRLDFYEARQFALDRQVLEEQGFDRPDMLLAAWWERALPDLSTIIFYEDVQLKDIGETAGKAGRTDDALAAYWRVAHFGERLGASPMDITQICSNKLRRDAYSHILPLLRSKGRAAEAALVESILSTIPSRYSWPANSSLEAAARRSSQVIVTSAILAVILGIATAFWLISVVALKWRSDIGVRCLLNRLASSLCFAPPALLLASIALFLAYYPYVRHLGQFASVQDLNYGYVAFFINLYNGLDLGGFREPWLTTMFWPLVWCAVVALAGVCLLAWLRSRTRPDNPDAA